MLEEATVIRNKAIFSDDKKHRLLLHREWDNEKPSAMIIMINPNSADNLSIRQVFSQVQAIVKTLSAGARH